MKEFTPQEDIPANGAELIFQLLYDPTTSSDPIPPSMRPVSPSPPLVAPTESATLSRHSATSSAWEQVSPAMSSGEDLSPPASGSGLSGEEMMSVPRSRHQAPPVFPLSERRPGHSHAVSTQATRPAQPPSLTLALFTAPRHITVARVFAVLGINLVLPFINGVMLGFGEIFAREVVLVGRGLYRDSGWRGLLGLQPAQESGYRRGVAGVGLSGSGGFP